MKGCRPSSSTPCRFANVLSTKHRVKKTLPPSSRRTRFVPDALLVKELNRASQQQQPIENGKLIDKVGALSTTLPSNGSSLVSAAKVQQNSETTKDLAKKNCLLSYHSAPIAGASVKAAPEDWRAVLPPIIAGVPRRTEVPGTSFSALSSRWRGLSASDVLAPLLTPLTLWRNPPIGSWHRRTGRWNSFQSNCRAR